MKYRNQLIKPFLSGAGVSEDDWARAFGSVYKNKQLEEIRKQESEQDGGRRTDSGEQTAH